MTKSLEKTIFTSVKKITKFYLKLEKDLIELKDTGHAVVKKAMEEAKKEAEKENNKKTSKKKK